MAPSLDIATNMFLGRELRQPGILGSVPADAGQEGMRAAGGRATWPS